MSAKKQSGAWRNMIIGHGIVPAGQLLAHELNWRVHSTAQQAAMRALIGCEVGWLQSVIVNKRTSQKWDKGKRHVQTVIDGHLRIQLALKENEESPVPVTYVDLDPRAERLALASFDRVGALAQTDDEQYDVLLSELADVPDDISAVLVRPHRKTKGLKHTVQECQCCKTSCAPSCGCWRDEGGKT